MTNDFNIIENIPLIIFALFFLVVFILFIYAAIVLLLAKGDFEKIQKGRKILLRAFIGLFIVLLFTLVFYSVSYFLKKGQVFVPAEVSGEFPSSPSVNFPPPPEVILIGEYYFNGPVALKSYTYIKPASIYSILCKNNDEYDIIYIGEGVRKKLLEEEQYKCWISKCGNDIKNLYLAIFWAPEGTYNPQARRSIKTSIEEIEEPLCASDE